MCTGCTAENCYTRSRLDEMVEAREATADPGVEVERNSQTVPRGFEVGSWQVLSILSQMLTSAGWLCGFVSC